MVGRMRIIGTMTGRVCNAERELRMKALEQSRAISRPDRSSNVTVKLVPKDAPIFIDIDFAAIERRMVARLTQ